jgi:hypothetical protein
MALACINTARAASIFIASQERLGLERVVQNIQRFDKNDVFGSQGKQETQHIAVNPTGQQQQATCQCRLLHLLGASITSARPTTADSVVPPARLLASVMMSGDTP